MQAQGKDQGSAVVKVVKLFGASIATGVLVAAVALPAVGGAGMTVNATTDELQLRPEELKEPPLPEKTTLLDADGKQFAQFHFNEGNRESVKLDQVADVMKTAIVAIEDYRFYEHGAIDLEGTFRAAVKNVSGGGVIQGGSSITQQYVKLVLLNSAETKEEQEAAVAPTFSRKLNELRHALAVEEKYTKSEILERYLNISYFGAGAYGIETASRRFFDKPASKLNLWEAATLAGAVQNPSQTDPSRGKAFRDRLLERRNVVLNRMAELGKITQQEADEAKKKKLGWKDIPAPGGCEESDYPYFCLYVQHELLTNEAFGKSRKQRERTLERGGLVIKTTLDRKAQKASEKAIKQFVKTSDKPVAAQAMVVPGTGAIKAMAASRKFGGNKKKNEISYNLVGDAAHGGGGGFQAGSTFKPFTLLTALEQGMKLNDGFTTGSGYNAPSYGAFRDCKGNAVGDPKHTVSNSSEGGGGFKTLTTGTLGSVNTFFLRLEEEVGLCETVKMAKRLGIKRADGRPLAEVETFTLGPNEMDPVTVAGAYAAIAARGTYCKPMVITESVDRDGKATPYKPECKQVLDEEVADAASHIMSGVFTKGTMSQYGGIGRPAAGKTGTTDGYTAAWFAGFTPDLASAVSIGDPRGAFKHPLLNVNIGGQYYGYVYGATISGRIWKYSMIDALKGVKATPFTPVNMDRFGGCSAGRCAPKPPPKPEGDDDGGDRGPDGPGDGEDGNGGTFWPGNDGGRNGGGSIPIVTR
ncbi:membrane peptidoglycan carboxypeptidase [Streptosporangium becharense]|uniref:Membrane peptidoglycan carboxypeptidase n=1 Tax=Streptosporangium becharense TaxID=1816182 RepID=A0A7W9IFZ8_9ACTN|nr:transglycosylase domain-containing protein [Streptosporangium becharense]MBB2908945.1 membrane peptidoglycan carboxypeptidase [Streptosporangium becharense]MBB5820037.1 membrane peptidoglycan carboxypeptidase [Streptosporangium becharense]